MFVSPSNPTGSVYTPEETKAIGEWAVEHGIWIISDEIYQNLVYEGARAVSIVEAVPDAAAQTILVNGVAKTYAMTGWRLGWMVGPKDAIKLAANLQSHLSSNVNNIAQRAALAALTGPQNEAEEFRLAFDRRRKLIVGELAKIEGVTVPNPLGAFYVYPDVQGLLGRDLARQDADDLARARRSDPRRGRGRRRARRGVRPERLPAAVVRARRRSRCSRASGGCRSSSPRSGQPRLSMSQRRASQS